MKLTLLSAILLCIGLGGPAVAQTTHYIATKEEGVVFDTAMVVKLSAYRKEFKELQRKEKLIDSLQALLAARTMPDTSQTIYAEPPVAIQPLPPNLTPDKERNKKLKWYLNPVLSLGAGLLIGVYLID